MNNTVHYKTTRLNPGQRIALVNRAYDICQTWWVDVLDCSKSFCRQKIEMSFDEIMHKYTGSDLSVVERNTDVEHYLEIGFRIFGSKCDYFLWLILDLVHIPEITGMLK